ncbi:MAG: phage portal protein [Gammaproteobacteria bacterium]|nr:phage portal protein [Gammaproteobacteria bacterium]
MKIYIDLSSLIRGEGTELADYLSKLVNGGIITINESRNMIGLIDVDNGDVIRSPVNTAPLDQWLQPKIAREDFSPAPNNQLLLIG